MCFDIPGVAISVVSSQWKQVIRRINNLGKGEVLSVGCRCGERSPEDVVEQQQHS